MRRNVFDTAFAVLRDGLQAFLGEGHVRLDRSAAQPVRPIPPVTLCVALAVWVIAAGCITLRVQTGTAAEGFIRPHAGEYVFELAADARQGDFGKSAKAEVVLDDGRRLGVIVSYEGDDLFFARERIEGRARFSTLSEDAFARYAPEGILCRATLEDARYADDQGVLASLLSARRWATGCFDEIAGMGSALLRALLIGDRSHLDEGGLYDAMKTVGLAHMVAVSGAHLSTVGAFVSAMLVRVGVSRRVLVAVLCAFYAAYSVFTGLSAPVVRAAVMAAVAVSCIFASRRASPLAALSVCVCVLIALNPSNAVSLSFFLSAASTFGVVVFSGLFSSWFAAACGGRLPIVSDTCGMTMAANLPIFPVTASVFARLPLISPVANLLAAPAFSLLLIGGLLSLGAAAIARDAGMVLLRGMCVLADLFCRIALALSHIPYASLPFSMGVFPASVVAVIAIAVLWRTWPRVAKGVVRAFVAVTTAALLVFAFVAQRASPDEIVMLDVGQGDAILVRSQGATLLVDTGNRDTLLMEALARRGVVALDGVAITHHDDDHCASLPVLDSLLSSGGVFVSEPTLSCGCEGCDALLSDASRIAGARGVSGLAAGQVVRVGRFSCTAVWPHEFQEEGGNGDSLCLLVEYDAQGDGVAEASALLTGDAEAEQLEAIVDEGLVEDVDVFKAGHHGSKNGVSKTAFEALSPAIALVSVGEGNRYGHPSPETLGALDDVGARVFRTDLMGDVSCRFSEEGIEVFTQRDLGL